MSLTPLKIKSVKDADVAGKRVLVRVDFNVPIKDGVVQSDLRIRAALPTLELLHKGAAHIILLAHLGRPNGKPSEPLKLAPMEARVRELTQVPFEMRENLRFDPRRRGRRPVICQRARGPRRYFYKRGVCRLASRSRVYHRYSKVFIELYGLAV